MFFSVLWGSPLNLLKRNPLNLHFPFVWIIIRPVSPGRFIFTGFIYWLFDMGAWSSQRPLISPWPEDASFLLLPRMGQAQDQRATVLGWITVFWVQGFAPIPLLVWDKGNTRLIMGIIIYPILKSIRAMCSSMSEWLGFSFWIFSLILAHRSMLDFLNKIK